MAESRQLGNDHDLMLRQYAEQYELYEAQKAELETELARRAWDVPEVKDLVTIEGIGPYSASLLVFGIGPIDRFENLGNSAGSLDRLPESARAARPSTSTMNATRVIAGCRRCSVGPRGG